jgi:hypothetical protein
VMVGVRVGSDCPIVPTAADRDRLNMEERRLYLRRCLFVQKIVWNHGAGSFGGDGCDFACAGSRL